jgi:hypothetical protein
VPEPLGDNLGVHPLGEHERRVGVAKVVEPDGGKALAPQEQAPARGERAGVKRSSPSPVDDEPARLPRCAERVAAPCLVASLALQEGTQERGQESTIPRTSLPKETTLFPEANSQSCGRTRRTST